MRAEDEYLSGEIQNRLKAVGEVNKQLNSLRTMMARVEGLSDGDFGAE
jgi:hypothetical protein